MFDLANNNPNELIALPQKERLVLHYSKIDDLVGDTYRIQLNQSLGDLSNEYCRYYTAIHSETNQEYFAIVFERNFAPDLSLIKAIMDEKEINIVKPLAVSVTKLSTNKVKHLVVIVEKYDYKKNLAGLVETLEENDTAYITSKLLPFFCSVIKFSDTNYLSYGNINPSNIIIVGEKLLLREPFIAYPHSLQQTPFLATEIFEAEPQGRLTNNSAADIFAIGITFIYVYFKGLTLQSDLDKFKRERADLGSFVATVGKKRISDEIKNHIKGCINDNITERWKVRNLVDWLNGKLSSLKSSSIQDHSGVFAAVSFNGNNCESYRALASALFNNWDLGLNFLSEDRILKWIQRGVGKSKIIDYLDELASREIPVANYSKGFLDKDEKLSKAITILDTQGPIRLNQFSSHISSLKNVFHYAFMRQKKAHMDSVIKIALKKNWEDISRYESRLEQDVEQIEALNDISSFFIAISNGCGIERVLYHLHPDTPCLSPLVYNEYITELSDLLVTLDKIAASNPEKLIFDKHILSFIANKIDLKREDYVLILKDIPANIDSLSLYGLALIVMATRYEQGYNLMNLASVLGKRLCEFINRTINNVKIRKNLEEKIKTAVEKGDHSEMLKVIGNPRIFINDQSGYYKASRDINLINKKIAALTNISDVKHYGIIFGQRITVLISYLLFALISLFMVF